MYTHSGRCLERVQCRNERAIDQIVKPTKRNFNCAEVVAAIQSVDVLFERILKGDLKKTTNIDPISKKGRCDVIKNKKINFLCFPMAS